MPGQADSSLLLEGQPLSFQRIEAGLHVVGWRPDGLPAAAEQALWEYFTPTEWIRRVSPRREVDLGAFELAVEPVRFDSLFDPYEAAELESIDAVCNLVDQKLAESGLRLPTEDEFEVACGAGLFWWGDTVPEHDPYSAPNAIARTSRSGLRFLSDSYRPELVRTTFKLGDGGVAVCGDAPWPIAWMSLCTAHREWASDSGNPDDPNLLGETLEETYIRPVKTRRA